ncbi:uncharacterized protein LOC114458478 isoform X2 [Gouania willdenowi]|uniref:Carboxylic ester hydrolase n=1 Tax=Gouania willdenowi TaxID=441366 RepID=A0A8C5DCE6_GOUWI|nr:uncharacterized protein LOC114458478 isoform X2 [Gouania willdenowi]
MRSVSLGELVDKVLCSLSGHARMNEDAFEVPERVEYRYLVQDDPDEEVQYVRHRQYISPLVVLSRRCIVLIVFAVVALLLFACYLGYVAQTLPPGLAQVSTTCGDYKGRHVNGAYSFKGMPYAAPPVGALRWAPPADPPCSPGLREALHFSSVCAQLHPMSRTGTVRGQEDCLYLNVWTPTLMGDARLPVVVWIHGGYLKILSGGEEGYSPTEKLAADTGMVYVSFNYRLNAFGFMALEVLREGSPRNTSGNYGFLDQISALKWVQKNIHVFGGDPDRVTLMGHSSGGTSVWTLMTSPLAKGLFHRAVAMSGSSIFNASLEQVENTNLEFLKKTGCRDAACLRALSTSTVLQECRFWTEDDDSDLPTRGRFVLPLVAVDGYVLEDVPLEVWKKNGSHSDVPFVIGSTQQEIDFSPHMSNISTWTWDDYRWFVKEKLQTFTAALPEEALNLYPTSAQCPLTVRCPERLFTTMVSDIRVSCPLMEVAQQAAEALSSPVYRYVVTHTPSAAVKRLSDLLPFQSRFSFHGLDAVTFFRGLNYFLDTPLSKEDRGFQDLLTRNLVSFAKTGHMEKAWPEFPSATALLSAYNLSTVSNYSPQRCDLWRKNGLFHYAWIKLG